MSFDLQAQYFGMEVRHYTIKRAVFLAQESASVEIPIEEPGIGQIRDGFIEKEKSR
jgi:hypothetical protein